MKVLFDPAVNDYAVELNLTGKMLEPERITNILQVEPSCVMKPGTEAHACKHTMLAQPGSGLWAYEICARDAAEACTDTGLNDILNLVEPSVEALREAGVERIYLYCTMSSFTGLMNVRLSSAMLQRIGAISADLFISCFDCFDPTNPMWTEGDATGLGVS